MQDRFEGRLFFSSPSFRLPEIYQVQMERESLSVSLPLPWPQLISKDIHKTNEESNFGHAKRLIRLIIFQDYTLMMASTKKELIQARDT